MNKLATAILFIVSAVSICAQRRYELPEVVVTSKGREVLHLTGYMRELSQLTSYSDTVTLFREKMVDFMVPTKRAKGYHGWLTPRVLAVNSYYHFTSDNGLDSVSDYFSRHFSWADLVNIVDEAYLPAKLREADGCDTIHGRFGDISRWKRHGDNVSIRLDALADTTARRWVPYIYTFMHDNAEFDKLIVKYEFQDIESGRLWPGELSRISFDVETSGRGRPIFGMFKPDEPIFVSTHADLYITDREYLSVKQAKALAKADIEEIAILAPAETDAPQEDILALIDRVEKIDHIGRHVAITGDKRLAGIKDLFSTRRNSWQIFKDLISPPRYNMNISTFPNLR
ncbi:MAG: hypothetical protein NC217_07905 [Muribaculaceae bacterium]|nr:hypothetical protein [Muribaculaceae bacterium]